ncbi:MAG: methyltransferase, partial [Specibacter sp.]
MEPNAHVPTDDLVAALRAAGCVYAEDEAAILLEAAATTAELRAMTARRVTGQPLEHIVGWARFHGMRITVAPDVFVPRLRTEFLVRQALVVLTDAGASGVVLDLCCGSGAVGAALAVEVSGLDIHAADIDPAAVACARRNLGPFGGQAHCGDLFDALPERLKGRLSMITANAPY